MIEAKDLPLLYPEGYISGVLKGDGFCTTYIGLHVKDLDFAETFANAMRKKFQIELMFKQEAAGYWVVRKSNITGKYTDIVSLSKGGGPAASRRREPGKSATKTDASIVHEDAGLEGREPLQLQHGYRRKEPGEICVAVDD